MTLDNAENALAGNHLGAVGAGNRLALVGWHLISAQIFASTSTQRAKTMRHAPDAVLIGHQHVVALPGEAIGSVEIFDVAIDPYGVPGAVVAQQGQVAGALLGHENIAVRQNQQASWIGETGRKRCCRKTGRHLRYLPAVGDGQRPVGNDRTGLRRGQICRIDVKAPADLMLDQKVARWIVGVRRWRHRLFLLRIGVEKHRASDDRGDKQDEKSSGLSGEGRVPLLHVHLRDRSFHTTDAGKDIGGYTAMLRPVQVDITLHEICCTSSARTRHPTAPRDNFTSAKRDPIRRGAFLYACYAPAAGSASARGLQLSRRRGMSAYQIGEIKSRNLAVLDDPASADHDAFGAMRAAENERGQRIAAAGKARFVELEERQIGHLADRDFSDIRAADAGGGAFGGPAQRVLVADFL